MQTMKFSLEKDYLDNYTVKDSYGNEHGTFDSLQDARDTVESLTSQFTSHDCGWNGHPLDNLEVVELAHRFGTDRVCREHEGLYRKSLNTLAESHPTVRGNE